MNFENYESMKKKDDALKKKAERKRKQMETVGRRHQKDGETLLRLQGEIFNLEDARTVLLSRMGRSAQEAQELLESTLPPMPEPEEEQAQNAPESEVIHEETE